MPWVSARIVGVYKAFDNVGIVYAGDTQNILCNTTVQLEGSVTGDVSKHVVEWEQLSGTPVTLNDETTLTPWFVNPNTTDFDFRLWIDRYTAYEKYDDIHISREPASFIEGIMSPSTMIDNSGHTSIPISISVESMGATEGMAVQPPLLFNPSSPWVEPTMFSDQNGTYLPSTHLSNSTAMLRWNDPLDAVQIALVETQIGVRDVITKEYLGTIVQKFNTTSRLWETVTTVPAGGYNYYNLLNNGVYRLVASWQRFYRNKQSQKIYTKKEYIATSRIFRGTFPSDTSSVISAAGTSISDFIMNGSPVIVRKTFSKKVVLEEVNITNEFTTIARSSSISIARYLGDQAPDVEEDMAPSIFNADPKIVPAATVIYRAYGTSIG